MKQSKGEILVFSQSFEYGSPAYSNKTCFQSCFSNKLYEMNFSDGLTQACDVMYFSFTYI